MAPRSCARPTLCFRPSPHIQPARAMLVKAEMMRDLVPHGFAHERFDCLGRLRDALD